eukprot:TRINITY_DN24125_c0_g1_i2.p1 TRINITY_DN24125_c0_g1~~TRINITY_DN24125_c0_g1_i2.p1  ORF type:complete len:372 (+),score=109.87 TRINITY_DN24125_c0_g1_i2:147-1262(+)
MCIRDRYQRRVRGRSNRGMALKTPLTELLGIEHPVMLAGMNAVAHGELVAAVTNAGGIGTIGGLLLSPKALRQQIHEAKQLMTNKEHPKFGVDLAIPQIGGNARKTNHDYTHGRLPELIDVTIEEGASLFVCAIGVPPSWAVDKLHAAGIPVMNMIGHPKHVDKALAAGVDIICAQGSEAGGHTGDIATTVLIPSVVDACKGRKSPLTGDQVLVVAAGGIYDGRGLAAMLSYGAAGVWVGTRFVAAAEAAAPDRHKKGVVQAAATDTVRTLIYSGRPVRTLMTPYVRGWEENRQSEIRQLCDEGKVPVKHDVERKADAGEEVSFVEIFPLLMGQACGPISSVQPAKTIVEEMVATAVATLQLNQSFVRSKL